MFFLRSYCTPNYCLYAVYGEEIPSFFLTYCVCTSCIALTPILLTWTIWRAPTNASKWRMGFNSAFKGLIRQSGGTCNFSPKHDCELSVLRFSQRCSDSVFWDMVHCRMTITYRRFGEACCLHTQDSPNCSA